MADGLSGFFKRLFGKEKSDAEKVSELIEEAITLGRTEKFLKSQDEFHDDKMLHIRTREIGRELHELGGMELMRDAFKKITKEVTYPGAARELEYCWGA